MWRQWKKIRFKMFRFLLLILCVFLFGCDCEEQNIYKYKRLKFQLPQNFSIEDSQAKFEHYRWVVDQNNEKVLCFRTGNRTPNSGKVFANPRKDNVFTEAGRFDLIESNKRKVVVILAARTRDRYGDKFITYAEFGYYPKDSDSTLCEKIISSARVNFEE